MEIDDQGKVIRSASSADPAFPDELLTPYSLVVLPELDRVVSTDSAMADEDVFRGLTYQVWRLSDLKLLKTSYLDPGTGRYAHISPEEPRLGPDGAIYVQTYACGIERITGMNTDRVKSQLVYVFPGAYCGVPTIIGHFLIESIYAQMAYPDDPAAAEAALQIPNVSEVVEATAEPEASTPEDPKQNENEVLANHIVEPDIKVRSWADITDSEERKRLATEWKGKGPALPEGLTREELIVWLNANWPPG